jgi:hypothetical protein
MTAVQEIFHAFYPDYAEENKLSDQQQKVARAIMHCHTQAMGANVSVCEECGHEVLHYNSCRNRHCPSCQGVDKDVWADKRSEETINAPYFHVVFTMPAQLQMLIYQNKELLYGLMYQATSETLYTLTKDSKYLGAKPGFFSVLHTWGQDLHYHPHIHMILVGGGLTQTGQWRSASKKFFIPVKVLAKMFRGKFLRTLKFYYDEQKLNFFGDLRCLENESAFKSLLTEVYKINWYVYTKRTFSGPQAVVKYLARYTHRIAIANSRIVNVGDHTVTFKVRDYKDKNDSKLMTLSGSEFIRRFLMHVLPNGFVKIRYYGILATCNRKTKLVLCQKLTNTLLNTSKLKGLSIKEVLLALFGRDVTLCPCCGIGKLIPLGGQGSSP